MASCSHESSPGQEVEAGRRDTPLILFTLGRTHQVLQQDMKHRSEKWPKAPVLLSYLTQQH